MTNVKFNIDAIHMFRKILADKSFNKISIHIKRSTNYRHVAIHLLSSIELHYINLSYFIIKCSVFFANDEKLEASTYLEFMYDMSILKNSKFACI